MRAGNAQGKKSLGNKGQALNRGWAEISLAGFLFHLWERSSHSHYDTNAERKLERGSVLRLLSGHASRKHFKSDPDSAAFCMGSAPCSSSLLSEFLCVPGSVLNITACHEFHTTVLPCVSHSRHYNLFLSKLTSKDSGLTQQPEGSF